MASSARRTDILSLALMLGFVTASLSLSLLPVIVPQLEAEFDLSGADVGPGLRVHGRASAAGA